jgi:protein-export membrane protein SecD
MYVEYSGKAPEGSTANFDELVEGTMSIIQQRLSDKGFNEANVQRIGVDGIRVEIPDVQDDTVLDLIGTPAKLEFYSPAGEVFMTGDMVKTATYYYADGDHQISFQLTDEGTKIFADMTSASIGQTIAIYLDGEQLIAPKVQTAITNGSGVINGLGSAERATTIAAKIQSGALPLELTQQKVDKVSATLGQDAVSSSVKAAVIGIALIMLLMIVRYRLNGFIASWALTIYIILLFMLIAVFRIQLTLPGLAGVVLGIGMAVDANVIIFERFNEETRKGRSAKAAVRAGFKNAMSAILDANVTTLIAAIVLLIFGTGSIQGFAKTLLLGVVVSMFTAILVTRFLMNRFVAAGATKVSLFTRMPAEEKEVQA